MNKDFDKTKEFLSKMAEALEIEDDNISENSNLSDFNFDSLAIISTISLVDEFFNTVISMDQLSSCKKIQDIIELTK